MVALEDSLLSEHGAAPAADDLLGRRLRGLHLCGLHQRRQPQFRGLARARAPAAAVVEPVRGSRMARLRQRGGEGNRAAERRRGGVEEEGARGGREGGVGRGRTDANRKTEQQKEKGGVGRPALYGDSSRSR
jgi:hypothetical protein